MPLPDDQIPDETPLPETDSEGAEPATGSQESREAEIAEAKAGHADAMEDMGDVAAAESGLTPADGQAPERLPVEKQAAGQKPTLPKAERQKNVQRRAQERAAARQTRLGKAPTARSRRGQAYDQDVLDDLSKVAAAGKVDLFPQDSTFIPGSGDEKFPLGDQMADRASSEADFRVTEQLRNAAELRLWRLLAEMNRDHARQLDEIYTLLERDRL